MIESKGRAVGGTEYSWCRAVPGGTGIAVLAILTNKVPENAKLRDVLSKLQTLHPILRSRLHTNPSKNSFSFVTSSTPFVQVKSFNLSSTLKILESLENLSVPPLQLLLEHELNQNDWSNINRSKSIDVSDVFFASTYELPVGKFVLVLRMHVTACDRTSAVALLRELLVLGGQGEGERKETLMKEIIENEGEVNLAIEDMIPKGKNKKSLWTRGMDMLSYSVNSLRSTSLKFIDTKSARSSQVVRFKLNKDDTDRILLECKSRGIKLCGAIAAAGVIAEHNNYLKRSNSYHRHHHQRKYAIVTLTDCRSILDPPLSNHSFGFYHSALMNTHVIKGGEKLWDLAEKMYMAFANAKNYNKHFSDMTDLNFLMRQAIENPNLTPSSSLRSSFMSVFEDTAIDNSDETMQQKVGLEDYMGCASVHGIGPSIAVFDAIRNGQLDCLCVYPAPLHSREQVQALVENMKNVLLDIGK